MPRIKRWFPVSHDINRDPEIWAMRREIGEKSLSVWLEFLSIADRNDGDIPGDLKELMRSMAGTCQATVSTVSAVYQFAISRLWLDSQPTLRVAKYSKYHRTQEHKQVPSEPDPTEPDLYKNKIKTKATRLEVVDTSKKWPHPELLIELYNSKTSDDFPAVEKTSAGRLRKAREYLKQFPETQFWEEVFAELNQSNFLRGLQNGNGHASFRANFDWLLTKGKDGTENVVKVYEGRYRNGTR